MLLQVPYLLLGLLGLALGAPSTQVKPERGNCPELWLGFNGRCYKFVSELMFWAQAEMNCVSQDANLVSVHSDEEHEFVLDLIHTSDQPRGHAWIGLTDTQWEGVWMWSDGSKVVYSSWLDNGNPDNGGGDEHCVSTNWGNQDSWNDYRCHHELASVCVSRAVLLI